ncbi:YdcF family protein [Leptospira congkakensis]|uniref:YdcF family protein n=1 Tax=Leptospira congkakensis TaxID=2484932 RepID=A0A4Z0ZYX2_9LEPT|nr:YdcF family protein [Leptospira congkakensis]TGL87401.1 YdcF family protein [Leptospira congkakensis]TGL92970.1 YdcF family protein [Leptospira congkakensis]TGL93249.1 YdcF family protein [Leptospira congkakensis]
MIIENHKKITEEDLKFAKSIWNFLSIRENIQKSDLIFVLCSHDLRIAKYAVQLYKQGFAKFILFSGGLNFFTKNIFPNSEAESFAEFALSENIPMDAIIIENESTNTGENIQFSKQIIDSLNLTVDKIIAIQKPSMTLRIKLALNKQWNDGIFYISSPNYTLSDAPHSHINLFMIINEIVGDLQRIIEYPKLGFQSETVIPDQIIEAYYSLIENGYNLHLIQ